MGTIDHCSGQLPVLAQKPHKGFFAEILESEYSVLAPSSDALC